MFSLWDISQARVIVIVQGRTQGLIVLYKFMKFHELCHEKTVFFAYAKTRPQISCAVTAQLTSAFVFATRVVRFFFFLNPKFQASSYLLLLHMSDLIGNPDNRFSRAAAHISLIFQVIQQTQFVMDRQTEKNKKK